MKFMPTAFGYLRSDVSGIKQDWDETQIRSLARRYGYDLAKIVVFKEGTDHPLRRLKHLITQLDAEAVFVPSLAHFVDESLPEDLRQRVNIITVTPENTHARWPTPPRSASDIAPSSWRTT